MMYAEKLERANSFDEIFSIVKSVVAKKLGLHRAGLSLVLADLPPNILALHEMGSNTIVMNRQTLEAISVQTEDKIVRNSYIFVTLLHEYLHSFGFADERKVREMVANVVVSTFGREHPTYIAAVNPLTLLGGKQVHLGSLSPSRPPTIVRDFDRESTPYIG
jgi:hypothetical protein